MLDSLFIQFFPDWPLVTAKPKVKNLMLRSPPTFFEEMKSKIRESFGSATPPSILKSRTKSFSDIDIKSYDKKANHFKNILTTISIQTEKIESLKAIIKQIEESKEPLRNFSENLSGLVDCQISGLYLYDSFRNQLLDFTRNFPLQPKGLVKKCIETCEIIYIPHDAYADPDFSADIDTINDDSVIDSFMAVPVLNISGSVLGIMVYINFKQEQNESDIQCMKSLAFILWELSLCTDVESNG